MTGKRRNYLKECREIAGLTVDKAACELNVSVRSLHKYESDGYGVPLDIVAKMSKVYKTPMLARWYVRYRTEVGEYMPEVYDIHTEGDMFLKGVMAQDNLNFAMDGIKVLLLDDGKITPDEIPPLVEHIAQCKDAIANATSLVSFAEKIVARTEP